MQSTKQGARLTWVRDTQVTVARAEGVRERSQREVQGSKKEKESSDRVTHGLRTQGKDLGSYLERDERRLEDFEQRNDTIRHTFWETGSDETAITQRRVTVTQARWAAGTW